MRTVRFTRPVVAALLGAGAVVLAASPASAHHAAVSGTVACASDGRQTITWTVYNSETVTTSGGTGRTMTLDQVNVSSGSVVGIAVGSAFPPRPQPNSTRTGTTSLPGAQRGTVTLQVRADWAGGPQDLSASGSVALVGPCPSTTTTTAHVAATTTTTTQPATTTTTAPATTTTQPGATTTTAQPAATTTTAAQPVTTTTTARPATTTTAVPKTGDVGGATSGATGQPVPQAPPAAAVLGATAFTG